MRPPLNATRQQVELWEERASILEYLANFDRAEAERLAYLEVFGKKQENMF